MKKILIALLLGVSLAAQAQSAPYDQRLADQRDIILQLMFRTDTCLRQTTGAFLRAGRTGRDDVTQAAIGLCGRSLYGFLTRAGWKEADAMTVILAMADKQYDDAVAWGSR